MQCRQKANPAYSDMHQSPKVDWDLGQTNFRRAIGFVVTQQSMPIKRGDDVKYFSVAVNSLKKRQVDLCSNSQACLNITSSRYDSPSRRL